MKLHRGVYEDHGQGPNGEPLIAIVDGRGTRVFAGPIPAHHDPEWFRHCCRDFLRQLDAGPSTATAPDIRPLRRNVGRRRVDRQVETLGIVS